MNGGSHDSCGPPHHNLERAAAELSAGKDQKLYLQREDIEYVPVHLSRPKWSVHVGSGHVVSDQTSS